MDVRYDVVEFSAHERGIGEERAGGTLFSLDPRNILSNRSGSMFFSLTFKKPMVSS